MKIRIFDQLDSRTSGCSEMHLITLAVVAFGLTETLNYVFNFGSGGECVYPILSYRPAALNTLNLTVNLVFSSVISLQKFPPPSRASARGGGPSLTF